MDEIRDAWEQGSLAASLETDLATRVSKFHAEEGEAEREGVWFCLYEHWKIENDSPGHHSVCIKLG